MELSRDAAVHLLRTWPVARLATLRADGSPALVPVVFALSAGRIWMPVDGKPKRGGELARVANLRRNPRAGLLLDHYESDWSGLWWLRVQGRAHPVGADEPGFEIAAAALTKKYPQYTQVPLFQPGAPPTLIAFTPERITSWAASEDVVDFLG